MADVLGSIVKTTELEAINSVLSAIGRQEVAQADIESATDTEIIEIISHLRKMISQVLVRGWRWNTTFELEITADGDGYINLPSGYLSAVQSRIPANADRSLEDRNGKMYDMRNNTFATEYDSVKCDVITAVDFTEMPEQARAYITSQVTFFAARKFTSDESLIRLHEREVISTWHECLRKEQHGARHSLISRHIARRRGV